ncbi:MAG: thiamine pyrophosphate-binding protein [SAR202 cluster bacterium]|nr:thiamine pyrophosphate-binding protein [SAR202 cluster bacterium]
MSAQRRMSGSEIIARALRQEGVADVFALAGDHVLPVMNTMAEQDFRFWDTRHEQAAVHMADAWARITGQMGVSMVTTPGHANALPGLVHAMHTEAPVLHISGSDKLSNYDRGMMQEIDQVAMAKAVTKGAWLVHDARRIPNYIALAVRAAFAGRRGPVSLTIPIDVQEQLVDERDVRFQAPAVASARRPVGAMPEQARAAVRLLHGAKQPIVIAASPAAYHESATPVLAAFIETTRLPLLTEGSARGVVPDDHPYCFGFFDATLNRAASLLREADVVLLLGKKIDYTIAYGQPPAIAAGAKIIQIDPSATEIGKNRDVEVGIAGDVAGVVEQMTAEARSLAWHDLPWLARFRAERAAQEEWVASKAIPESPAHPLFVHQTVGKFIGRDDVVVFDGGDYCHFGKLYHASLRRGKWWALPHLGMLGSAIPTALAAQIAFPKARVAMMTGDGAFGFNGMEFDTAVRHRLHIVGVVGNDSAWGIDRRIQVTAYGHAVATDLLPTRYDKIVEGLGGHAEHVDSPELLESALRRAFDAGKPALVNVAIQGVASPRGERAIARRKAEVEEAAHGHR